MRDGEGSGRGLIPRHCNMEDLDIWGTYILEIENRRINMGGLNNQESSIGLFRRFRVILICQIIPLLPDLWDIG